ncbi:MAG TPA: hypothetical protein VH813_10350 [Candidatus Limnocylindrales bacterium]
MIDDPRRAARHWLAALAADRLPGVPYETIAVGWATVELERAADEIARDLGTGVTFVAASPDALLGANCLVAKPGDAPAWVLMEPSTEGPLAAFLVRHGEGLAAGWLKAGQGLEGVRRSLSADTPLGRARLVVDGPRWGPFLLLLEEAQ